MNRSSRLCTTAMAALILAIWLMLVQPVAAQTLSTGDVNGDGAVNVIDVQLTVNVALGVNMDPTTKSRADVNGDGLVNVIDVQRVVNIVLHIGSSISITSFSKLSADPFSSLIINGTGFDPVNGAISVQFVPLGTNVPIVVPVFVASSTSVTVSVPPLFDKATGQFSSGSVGIQVIQVSGSTLMTSNVLSGLNVAALPSVNLPIGDITRAYLNLALTEVQRIKTFAAGLPNAGSLASAANTYGDNLNTLLAAVNTIRNSPQQVIALPTANGTSFTLDAATLATSDRIIMAMLTQIMNQIQTGTFASIGRQFAWPPANTKNPWLHLVQLPPTTCPNQDPGTQILCNIGYIQYRQNYPQQAFQAVQFGAKVETGAYLSVLGGAAITGFQAAGVIASAAAAKAYQIVLSVASSFIAAYATNSPPPTTWEVSAPVGAELFDTWAKIKGVVTLANVFTAYSIFSEADKLQNTFAKGLVAPAPTSDIITDTRAALIFMGSVVTATVQRVRLPLGQETLAIMNVLLPMPAPECDQCTAIENHCDDQCSAQTTQCFNQCSAARSACHRSCDGICPVTGCTIAQLTAQVQCNNQCIAAGLQCEDGCFGGPCHEQCNADALQCFSGPPACQ